MLETPGLYAITRADWQGELPEGVQRIDVPTTMVWTIARIVLSGQEDLPNVRAIQDKMQLMPLSAYQRVDGPPPQAAMTLPMTLCR